MLSSSRADAAMLSRREFITPRGSAPRRRPLPSIQEEQPAELVVVEVDRQELEQEERQRRDQHADGGKGPRAVTIRESARDRTSDQEASVNGNIATPAHSGVRAKS